MYQRVVPISVDGAELELLVDWTPGEPAVLFGRADDWSAGTPPEAEVIGLRRNDGEDFTQREEDVALVLLALGEARRPLACRGISVADVVADHDDALARDRGDTVEIHTSPHAAEAIWAWVLGDEEEEDG